MSTNDVPGHNPSNADKLANGSWAEADDGSLLLVMGNEGGTVYFHLYDLSSDPVTDWMDAMAEQEFKTAFSWDVSKKATKVSSGDVPMLKWTWHDKTPFPFNRVIKGGIKEGQRDASGRATIDKADRIIKSYARIVADALQLKAKEVDASDLAHTVDRESGADIYAKLKRAAGAFLDELTR